MKYSEKFRYKVLYFVVFFVAFAIICRAFSLQVISYQKYYDLSISRTRSSLPIKAQRGVIYDRYSRPLVANRVAYSVIFQRESLPKEQTNKMIYDVVEVFLKNNDNYIDELPISYTKPYQFTNTKSDELKTFIKNENATPQDVIDYLLKRYAITGFSEEMARRVAGVRYEMEIRAFGNKTPYTFAMDVDLNTLTVFKEQSDKFYGISTTTESIREYVDGTLASHILGRIGIIYAEEYAELKNQGYSMTDMLGKDGIEKELESELKGEDGIQSITANGAEIIKPAVDGNNVNLTIDASLQKTLENSLKNNIIAMRTKKDAGNANAGTSVVIDVNSGEILAMANYPSFDLSTFSQDYNSLLNNSDRPLVNRAISGAYEPGSTFKVLTAIAGLESRAVTPSEKIQDHGVFREYEKLGYAPACWIWNEQGGTHGKTNVVEALKVSCNYFFYEIGNRIGITTLNDYSKKFGLGQMTGIEISGESPGILAGPEHRSKNGREWYVGDTLQASIGQSENMFTPLQIANYIATVANGGTLYKPHLIKAIKDENGTTHPIVPTVVSQTEMEKANYQAIVSGMSEASEAGTAASVFANYKVKVGSKTGTASVATGVANAIFVAFAPLENPEIAIAVVVEHGGHGSYAAPIAKDVFDEYFNDSEHLSDKIVKPNELLR